MDCEQEQIFHQINVNDCVEFKLVRTPEDIRSGQYFRPLMCHQIFGDRELVYGYGGLKIKLYYTAGWMQVYFSMEYATKLRDIDPDDIPRKIMNSYQIPITTNLDLFEQQLECDKTFTPFGDLIMRFTLEGENRMFEIYFCAFDLPGFQSFYERLETFLVWYIDAANCVDFCSGKWDFFLVYEKYATSYDSYSYAAVGLTTVYKYFAYPNKVRPRISQVLILPPFQRKGICVKLLRAVYYHYTSRDDVKDITVEDPSYEFQKVRDFVDCQRVAKSSYFYPSMFSQGTPVLFIDKLHEELKLNKKQAIRVCEILRLKHITRPEDLIYYCIDVKRRLNQPLKRQKNVHMFASAIPNETLEEQFSSAEIRDQTLQYQYNELMVVYNSVIRRLFMEKH